MTDPKVSYPFKTCGILHSMQNKKYVRIEPFFDIGNFGVQKPSVVAQRWKVGAVVYEWCVQNVRSSAGSIVT